VVPVAVGKRAAVFRDVTPYSMVGIYQYISEELIATLFRVEDGG
jgi:hypothetical protein